MDNIMPLILGMAAVTYGPRLAPFLFFSDMKVPKIVDAFLKSIPHQESSNRLKNLLLTKD